MPIYTYKAFFYTEADWAEATIKARTPALALQRAREIEAHETETLNFQSYDSGVGVEHIEIRLTTDIASFLAAQAAAPLPPGAGRQRRSTISRATRSCTAIASTCCRGFPPGAWISC